MHKTFQLIDSQSTCNMHAITDDGFVRKFDNAKELIDYYYDRRLLKCHERKNKAEKIIKEEISELENKIRFLTDLPNLLPHIFQQTRVDIEGILSNNHYLRINNNYDYLLKMEILKVSREDIEEFESQLKAKKEQLTKMEKLTAPKIWFEELTALRDGMNEYETNRK